jgi:hypothetical protein
VEARYLNYRKKLSRSTLTTVQFMKEPRREVSGPMWRHAPTSHLPTCDVITPRYMEEFTLAAERAEMSFDNCPSLEAPTDQSSLLRLNYHLQTEREEVLCSSELPLSSQESPQIPLDRSSPLRVPSPRKSFRSAIIYPVESDSETCGNQQRAGMNMNENKSTGQEYERGAAVQVQQYSAPPQINEAPLAAVNRPQIEVVSEPRKSGCLVS